MKERLKHPDVERFLRLYRRVRDWTKDDPALVRSTARDDEEFQELCLDLESVESRLRQAEDFSRHRFAKTVGVGFISAWRDCEKRYSKALAEVLSVVSLAELGIPDPGIDPHKGSKTELQVQIAADEAREEARAVESAIEHAGMDIENMGGFYDEDYCEEVAKGIRDWQRLRRGLGFDLEGVFRRRKLIPFILVPPHISNRVGDRERLSLYTQIEGAHEAFVFGAPFAALALMRSILEVVLRDHYGNAGDLEAAINSAKLPKGMIRARLHRLRKLANKILHVSENAAELPANFEREIVEHLYLLRDLIEGSPRNAQRF